MPLFFLLSGFCLTIGYGKTPLYSGLGLCLPCGGSNEAAAEDEKNKPPKFATWRFFRNRFSRILPVYYTCMILATPLIFLGYSTLAPTDSRTIPGALEAIFGMSTMVIVHGVGPNGPGWTICTLFMFYLVYPWQVTILILDVNHIQSFLSASLFEPSDGAIPLWPMQLPISFISRLFWDGVRFSLLEEGRWHITFRQRIHSRESRSFSWESAPES